MTLTKLYGICDEHGSQLGLAYESLADAERAARAAATRYRCAAKVFDLATLRDVSGPYAPQNVPRDANGYPLEDGAQAK